MLWYTVVDDTIAYIDSEAKLTSKNFLHYMYVKRCVWAQKIYDKHGQKNLTFR